MPAGVATGARGTPSALDLACAGCGVVVSAGAPLFRCPNAASGDGRDHVLAVPEGPFGPRPWVPDASSEQPFVRYREGLWSWALARARGVPDRELVAWIESLDRAVAAVDGRGFRVTPFGPAPFVARIGGAPNRLWVKDETGNVAGSHKGRHLFGLALVLEVLERTGATTRAESDARGLAIASCGNAALAAAVIARAAGRPLRVFIPEDADRRVVARLEALGAAIEVCRRQPGVAGDPCVHAFRRAVAAGALPFCCQGSENGLTIEGGRTIAWEMAESLKAAGVRLDRLFVQVGGGALASATLQGLRVAVREGWLAELPRFHAVQTAGGAPLRRAWERLRDHLGVPAGDDAAAAVALRALDAEVRARGLAYARAHRAEFMWPWEPAPASVAHGILDDETYDWAEILGGTLESGGLPVVAPEARVREAHTRVREATAIRADATGTAGLAGLLTLAAKGAVPARDRIGVLVTGVERGEESA